MNKLFKIYNSLFNIYGPQGWWPAESPFEVMVGAILTQAVAWSNVEKAIANLKGAQALDPAALHRLPAEELAPLLRPAGYYNAKARKLGLDRTRFKNSRGKPVSGHYMSANDLAVLSRYAMRNSRFRSLCRRQTAVIRWPGHAVPVKSANRLLNYEWANGIKTGATAASRKCLLGSGKYDRRSLILVTLRQRTRDREETDAVALFKWGDAQYEQRLIVSAGDLVTTVPLTGGREVRAVAKTSLTKTVRRAAQTRVQISLLESVCQHLTHLLSRLRAASGLSRFRIQDPRLSLRAPLPRLSVSRACLTNRLLISSAPRWRSCGPQPVSGFPSRRQP